MGHRINALQRAGAIALAAAVAAVLCAAPQAFAAKERPTEATAPRAKGHPKISGAAEDGRVLSVGEGRWKGATPMSYSYQWEQCESPKAGCTPIAGATEATYRATSKQVRHKLRVLVTAANALGAATLASSPSKKIQEGSPLNLAPPEITANVLEGTTLTAHSGTWVGTAPFNLGYQWQRCSVLGGECQPIEGAAQATYTPSALDLASRLAVIVTASNMRGFAAARSAETLPVQDALPLNTLRPSITGLLAEDDLLSVSPGSWLGSEPISYAYQWQLCDADGEACSNITGATEPSLKLLTSYIGDTLDVLVTAENLAGKASATSSPTALVKGILPSNTLAPSITGSLLEGDLLSAATGTWTGTEPITYAYQWQLCNLLSKVCSNISGAVGPTLKLGLEDLGDALDVIVTAKNVAGSSSLTSTLTGEIGL